MTQTAAMSDLMKFNHKSGVYMCFNMTNGEMGKWAAPLPEVLDPVGHATNKALGLVEKEEAPTTRTYVAPKSYSTPTPLFSGQSAGTVVQGSAVTPSSTAPAKKLELF